MRRTIIGTAHIKMLTRRGTYVATFNTDVKGDRRTSTVFTHKPKRRQPWDVLARAYAWTFTEAFELPAQPRLYVPIPFADNGRSLVNLETVSEPAFSGIGKWLVKRNIETMTSDLVDGPCITEARFVQFLRSAV